MSRNHTILIAAALLLGGNAIAARFQQQPKAADKPAPKQRTVQITGIGLTHSDATGLGNCKDAELVDGDTIVKSDTAKWNMKTEIAETVGNLRMTDPRADASGEKAEIQFGKSKRLVVITGGVKITVKPKGEEAAPKPNEPMPVAVKDGKAVAGENAGKEDDAARKHPAVVTCDKAEYWYSKTRKYAILSGSFKVVQVLSDKTRTVTAHHAEWFGNEDKLVLHAPVHFEDTKGTKSDPEGDVIVYTAEGNERIEIPGKGVFIFKVDEDEEETPPAKPEKKKM